MKKATDIQDAVISRLRQFPEFAGLAIIPEREADALTLINTALATAGAGGMRPGAALLVGSPASAVRAHNAARLVIDPLGVTLTAFENPLYNRPPAGTGTRAADLALAAAAALLAWTPPGCGRPLAAAPGPNVLEDADGKGNAAASVALETSLELPLLRLPGEYGYTGAVASGQCPVASEQPIASPAFTDH